MEKIFTDAFLKEGILGIIILALGFIAWRLFKLLQDSQEKRITEARESAKILTDNTNALERLAELIRDRLPRIS